MEPLTQYNIAVKIYVLYIVDFCDIQTFFILLFYYLVRFSSLKY